MHIEKNVQVGGIQDSFFHFHYENLTMQYTENFSEIEFKN